jgi:hypothetical protein
VVAGIAVVLGLVVYLIIQANQPPSASSNTAAAQAEADNSPDLPGQWVDLATIYGASYPDDAPHVTRDVDYAADCSDDGFVCNTNPPAGGPHWGQGGCRVDSSGRPDPTPFCGPVPWGVYRDPWEPESLVHNMEHGGVIIWYNTDNQEVIDKLEEMATDWVQNDVLLVMAPYPDMEDDTIALTAWSRIDKFPVSEFSEERVEAFVNAHRCRFNPERMSGLGC